MVLVPLRRVVPSVLQLALLVGRIPIQEPRERRCTAAGRVLLDELRLAHALPHTEALLREDGAAPPRHNHTREPWLVREVRRVDKLDDEALRLGPPQDEGLLERDVREARGEVGLL